jgi:hypothetical protein
MQQREARAAPSRSLAVVSPRPRWLRWTILVLGWLFLVVGLLGFLLPIVGGWLPFGMGLLLLSREQDWARRLVNAGRRRFPRLAGMLDVAEFRTVHFIRRVGGWLRVGRVESGL